MRSEPITGNIGTHLTNVDAAKEIIVFVVFPALLSDR
jgi:hypothetical protein